MPGHIKLSKLPHKRLLLTSLICIFVANFAGCGSTAVKPVITPEESGLLGDGHEIIASYYDAVAPFVLSAAGAMPDVSFPPMTGKNNPTRQVRDAFLSELKTDFPRIATTADPIPPSEAKIEYQQKYLLTLEPMVWNIQFIPTKSNHYHMHLEIEATLTEQDTQEQLWRGYCRTEINDPSNAPTLQQLKSNHSAQLKQWVQQASGICGKQLADDLHSWLAFIGH